MSSGVFAVARNLFEHDSFADEPFTEREAWIWLIKEAAWRPRRTRVGRAVIALERGQCAFSTRFMAGKWKWSEAKVRRFLGRLKSDAMVVTKTDALATQITICKYDEYQRVSLPTDALATHSRRKEEDTGSIEGKRKEERGGASAEFAFVGKIVRLKAGDFERWRKSYPGVKDMVAELTKADDFYAENPPADGKWFFPVSKWLERAHKQATAPRLSPQEADWERTLRRVEAEAMKPMSPAEREFCLAHGLS